MRLLLTLLIFASFASATEKTPEFTYKGKPIDPLCIYESLHTQIVDLDNCIHAKEINIDGYTSPTNYRYHVLKDSNPGLASYTYSGYQSDAFVVQGFFIGGLTSRENFIKYYKISGNKLITIFSGPSGDRNNGGVFDAYMKNGSLYYDLYLTPSLFVMFFRPEEKYTTEIEKLPFCAICNFAKLHYKDHKLQSVNITDLVDEIQDDEYKVCFNHLHKKQVAAGKTHLNIKETKEFVSDVFYKCFAKKK